MAVALAALQLLTWWKLWMLLLHVGNLQHGPPPVKPLTLPVYSSYPACAHLAVGEDGMDEDEDDEDGPDAVGKTAMFEDFFGPRAGGRGCAGRHGRPGLGLQDR